MHMGLRKIPRLLALLLCCSCASAQERSAEAQEVAFNPPVSLELEHCPQEHLLRWRAAIGLRDGVDLSGDLPTWPSGYMGFIYGGAPASGHGMGGGTSHPSCACPEGLCPCRQAIEAGRITGWQLKGENPGIVTPPTGFDLRFSVPPGYEVLLPQGPPEGSKRPVRQLRFAFRLDPPRTDPRRTCHVIPVRTVTVAKGRLTPAPSNGSPAETKRLAPEP